MTDWVHKLREMRALHLVVANLRIAIGFGVLPAGLKKCLGQAFTDPDNVGVFHEFLHAFHATGPFYRMVGVLQVTGAVLLMTQRFSAVGAAILFPILVAIWGFVVSTTNPPTIIVVSLMLLGTAWLLLWDLDKWRGLFVPQGQNLRLQVEAGTPRVDVTLWERCGAVIIALYLVACAFEGGVYRPRGVDLGNPSFYLLGVLALFPPVALVVDQRRHANHHLSAEADS